MHIDSEVFGEVESHLVKLFTLSNSKSTTVEIINYGGIIKSLSVQDKNGNPIDVVLGYDTLGEYVKDSPYFGCLVGRYCNRIDHGLFDLDGQVYQLAQNDGHNHLHGGVKGFDKVVWDAASRITERGAELELNYLSPDGEEGYPGNLQVRVIYVLTDADELIVEYYAVSDQNTIVNLTQHSYFNLSGSATILDHELVLHASLYTPVNNTYIPTGEVCTVKNSALDFTSMKKIGNNISSASEELLEGGYDHNYIVDGEIGKLRTAAVLQDSLSGVGMEMKTTEPGVQFYSGNFLDGSIKGKKGEPYYKNKGLCLEAQRYPDSPNQQMFPPATLEVGEQYRQTTSYNFFVVQGDLKDEEHQG